MTESSALDVQVGGSHYKSYKVQPVQVIVHEGLPFLHGCIVKRLMRNKGNRVEDLQKILHEVDLIEQLHHGVVEKDTRHFRDAFTAQIEDIRIISVFLDLINEYKTTQELGVNNAKSKRLLNGIRETVRELIAENEG